MAYGSEASRLESLIMKTFFAAIAASLFMDDVATRVRMNRQPHQAAVRFRRRSPTSVVTRVMRQAVKVAFVAVTIIAPAREAVSATFTVHEPDGEGRVFVDILGTINDGDFQTFKDKTDQLYPIGPSHPKKQVIVTLISYGGRMNPALQIGNRIRDIGMYTFSSLPIAHAQARAHSFG
jgi:hypothetical protein